jgi:regulatory protein
MGRGVKAPPPITASYLEHATAWYLERHHTTSSHLKRLLMQRVTKSLQLHGGDKSECIVLVDAEIARLVSVGLLDDAQYARDRARSLHRRGTSAVKIKGALGAKGLSQNEQVTAVATLKETDADPEYTAAVAFAKKRRLGPWRLRDVDADGARKELAKLGRAGFSYGIARRVLNAQDDESS